MKAYLYKEDGSREAVEPAKPEEGFTLRRLRGFVKGPIEFVPVNPYGGDDTSEPMILVVNEEGRLRDMAANPMASQLTHIHIQGNALYCPAEWVAHLHAQISGLD